MSADEKLQIISVFDAVKIILLELNITNVDRESAEATLKLIQFYNEICNISERSLLRLNDCRDIILKQRGRKVEKAFESEVWGNLMLFYYETNTNMVSYRYLNCYILFYVSIVLTTSERTYVTSGR